MEPVGPVPREDQANQDTMARPAQMVSPAIPVSMVRMDQRIRIMDPVAATAQMAHLASMVAMVSMVAMAESAELAATATMVEMVGLAATVQQPLATRVLAH